MPFVRFTSSRPDASSGWRIEPTRALFTLRCDGASHQTTLCNEAGEVERQWDDPLAALAWAERFLGDFNSSPDILWAGYLSYDLGRLFERIRALSRDALGIPLFALTLHDRSRRAREGPGEHVLSGHPLARGFSRRNYEAAVARCIEYVSAGDVFQVNLSQRFSAGLRAQPIEVFRQLNESAPAAYGAFLDYGDHSLICNSPELFLRVMPEGSTGKRHVVTRPIKGTRPRLPGMDAELRDSVKDQAELTMIVDLERNDLGRVCEIGSVKVTERRSIEAHPTVYHGVATIEGLLRDDVTFVDLLRATFPGGSVTGAPKIRAMQIIEELEPVRRGPYCGAIGYLSADGHMQFNIAIRTIIVKDGVAHVSVGGGVVADSDPAAEYEETLVKARAMFAALGVSPDELERR